MAETFHHIEFPFEEKRDTDGDYFATARDVVKAGYEYPNQVWSVVESDGVYTYGPPHHYVNVLGYIGTEERHDNQTYYEEPAEGAETE